MRTRGWWTVEPSDVAIVVEAHGRELSDQETVEALSSALSECFGSQVLLSP